jgi:dipeptidyl aminopeptidase/acylaminoacyl peptidase
VRLLGILLLLISSCSAAELEQVSYVSSDGQQIPGVLRVPEGEGPFPALLVIHGGNGDWPPEQLRALADPRSFNLTIQEFGKREWVLLSTDYRRGGVFGEEEDDMIAAFQYLEHHPKVAPGRICAFGGSHGGHLALRLAQRVGGQLACVAAGSPWVTDPITHFFGDLDEPPLLRLSDESKRMIEQNRMEMRTSLSRSGTTPTKHRRRLKDHSILEHAEDIESPVLLVTSKGDVAVPHMTIQPLVERLQDLSKDVTVHTAESADHGFYMNARRFEEIFDHAAARNAILEFLERNLE